MAQRRCLCLCPVCISALDSWRRGNACPGSLLTGRITTPHSITPGIGARSPMVMSLLPKPAHIPPSARKRRRFQRSPEYEVSRQKCIPKTYLRCLLFLHIGGSNLKRVVLTFPMPHYRRQTDTQTPFMHPGSLYHSVLSREAVNS